MLTNVGYIGKPIPAKNTYKQRGCNKVTSGALKKLFLVAIKNNS